MIRFHAPTAFPPAARYGWSVLIECSGLLQVEDPQADVVQVGIAGQGRAVALEARWGFEVAAGQVTVPEALLNQLTDIVGAGQEQRSEAKDPHGRVPSSENPLVKSEQFRQPVLDRAAAALRLAVGQAAGGRPVRWMSPWPEGKTWAIAITHDLDLVAGWPLSTALRAAELLRGGQVSRLGRTVSAAIAEGLSDPVWQGVRYLLDLEASAGIRSTWFVICETPTLDRFRRGDVTYSPESKPARRIISALVEAGHEVGLHGSFETWLDQERMRRQRDRLQSLSQQPVVGIRQHFLRMRPGATQRAMHAAGFEYDSTFGFPDRNGFRLGAAGIVPAWDGLDQSTSALDEVPLTWMDRGLSKYQGVEDPERWVDDALELADACRAVNGLWVGLWHPNMTTPLGFPGAADSFRRLMNGLEANQPHHDTLAGLVAWQRLRRSVRADRVAFEGQVELSANARADVPVVLIDERGRSHSMNARPRQLRG